MTTVKQHPPQYTQLSVAIRQMERCAISRVLPKNQEHFERIKKEYRAIGQWLAKLLDYNDTDFGHADKEWGERPTAKVAELIGRYAHVKSKWDETLQDAEKAYSQGKHLKEQKKTPEEASAPARRSDQNKSSKIRAAFQAVAKAPGIKWIQWERAIVERRRITEGMNGKPATDDRVIHSLGIRPAKLQKIKTMREPCVPAELREEFEMVADSPLTLTHIGEALVASFSGKYGENRLKAWYGTSPKRANEARTSGETHLRTLDGIYRDM